jgi:hypothetical protein
MAQDKKENDLRGITTPEKRILTGEQAVRFDWEKEKNVEKKEISSDEKAVSDQLRKEIDLMELDEKTKDEADKKAQKIEYLGEKEKIEHLLQITREKGVVFAVQVAKKMNDPYLLDIFHDILAKEGYYKEISK